MRSHPFVTTASTMAIAGLTGLASVAHAGDCVPTWDGSIGQPGINAGVLFDFAVHDAGGDAELYASGSFTSIGGTAAARIARWDGSAWQALGNGLSSNECYAIASYGGDLYAAGYFNSASMVPGTAKIARWDGTAWNSLDAQLELFSNQLWDLVPWDDGSGEDLYVLGNFMSAGGVAGADFIARWDGTAFSTVGGAIGGAVPLIIFDAHVWDDGDGEALYIGGRFLNVDGVPASRIAKWDGTSWSGLGTGLVGSGVSPSVMSMVAFDDGTGEQLYVAGQTFTTAGGVAANRVARWDGENWSAVGNGFADGICWDLTVFDDGSGDGPALYAFGTFTQSGLTPLNGVAKWTGTQWISPNGGADDDCFTGITFDDGSGPALYVGGRFGTIAGVSASGVARLEGCPVDLTGDIDGDGDVDFADLLAVLSAWGPCPEGKPCPADVSGDDMVGFDDVLAVLANWS